jgi:hypothetical protein
MAREKRDDALRLLAAGKDPKAGGQVSAATVKSITLGRACDLHWDGKGDVSDGYRLGCKGKMTGHGFRSVASTWGNEREYSPDCHEDIQLLRDAHGAVVALLQVDALPMVPGRSGAPGPALGPSQARGGDVAVLYCRNDVHSASNAEESFDSFK